MNLHLRHFVIPCFAVFIVGFTNNDCPKLFSKLNSKSPLLQSLFQEKNDLRVGYNAEADMVEVNGKPVTTGKHYPTEVIKKHLQLDDKDFFNKTTLSIGEGLSDFVPTLVRRGHEAYGLDFWYDADLEPYPKLKRHVDENRANLIASSAEKIPLGEMFDLVVAHQSFVYLENPYRALQEALRVLKPGGEIRIYNGCKGGGCFTLRGEVERLSQELKKQVSVSVSNFSDSWEYKGRLIEIEGELVVIKKNFTVR